MNKSPTYCIGCAQHTAEVIDETEKEIKTLCGVCGKIRSRLKQNIKEFERHDS